MITVTPTAAQKRQASIDARKMGVLPNSFTYGKGNGIGMLAEIVAASWLGAERVRPPVYSHDLVLNNLTIDVKCKRCSSEPQPDYLASVVAKKKEVGIKADLLLFARIMDDRSLAYLCGWLPTEEFVKQAEFIKAGTRDGGFIHRVDGFHVPLSKLNPMESLLIHHV